MERVKCICGETKVFVENRSTCDKCPKNGFYADYDIIKELGVDEDVVYYDEKLRLQAEERISKEIARTESMDNGECVMGSNWNCGCALFICSSCGRDIDFVAFKNDC